MIEDDSREANDAINAYRHTVGRDVAV